MITILGRDIPNNLDELTIEQFEKITDINNNQDNDPIEKHLKIFDYLGIAESEFNDTDISEFIEIVKEFNSIPSTDYPIIESVTIDGYVYTAEMKLTVRDTKLIEKLVIAKQAGYISQMLAIMFKREDLSNVEHYTEAHLKHKASLFKSLNASISVPYMMFIANKVKSNAVE